MHRLTAVAGALLLCADSTTAQSPKDSAAVELLAGRHILARHPHDRIHLDSAFASSGVAPGTPTSRFRPASRMRQLAESLDARVSSAQLAGVVYIILSEPEFAADTARVTVTISYPTSTRRRSFYETLLVVLRRHSAGWRHERDLQLGIS